MHFSYVCNIESFTRYANVHADPSEDFITEKKQYECAFNAQQTNCLWRTDPVQLTSDSQNSFAYIEGVDSRKLRELTGFADNGPSGGAAYYRFEDSAKRSTTPSRKTALISNGAFCLESDGKLQFE